MDGTLQVENPKETLGLLQLSTNPQVEQGRAPGLEEEEGGQKGRHCREIRRPRRTQEVERNTRTQGYRASWCLTCTSFDVLLLSSSGVDWFGGGLSSQLVDSTGGSLTLFWWASCFQPLKDQDFHHSGATNYTSDFSTPLNRNIRQLCGYCS